MYCDGDWSHVRDQYELPPESVLAQCLMCTNVCGLFLEDACVPGLSVQLEQEAAVSQDFLCYFGCMESQRFVQAMHAMDGK